MRLLLLVAAGVSCAPPGVCEAPPAKHVKVYAERPRVQWNINGGFCGSFSFQTLMMAHGAYVSEDLVRKANIGAPCFGHGNGKNSSVCAAADDRQCVSSAPLGCEVGPENYAATCAGLRLDCDVWDSAQPAPQAQAYKRWLKRHLASGVPVVWVPMLKGASNTPYGPRSCPNGGHFNHHEPVLGLGSNRSLDDLEVYDDDWLLHLSDEDEGELVPYYRTFGSLEDRFAMDGNCAKADPAKSCAYPCFFDQVTYGVAVRGFRRAAGLPVSLDVAFKAEPDVRTGARPASVHASVTVRGLAPGRRYALYRYRGLNAFPETGEGGFEHRVPFVARGEAWRYHDPAAFLSSEAVYYLARSEETLVI